MSTTIDTTDLDEALAVARALSRRIRVAAERGDTVALERFTAQRRIATAEVDRQLRLVGTQSDHQ